MTSFINRLKLVFLGVFAVAGVAIWTYHLMWVWPGQRCEQHGGWWDWHSRVCATPVPLQMLTGRPGAQRIVPENPEVQQAPSQLAPGQTAR